MGESLQYVVTVEDTWVALRGWANGVWMGWTRAQQGDRVRGIANNRRFLILPEVAIPNLASAVLAHTTRRLAVDWTAVHGHSVALAETLVAPRLRGTAYQAAGVAATRLKPGPGAALAPLCLPCEPKARSQTPGSPAVLAAPFLPAALPIQEVTPGGFQRAEWDRAGGGCIWPNRNGQFGHRVSPVLPLGIPQNGH